MTDVPEAPDGDPSPRVFSDVNLRGARFVRADLSGAVMRAVDVAGMEVDAPWLFEGGATLLVNGVDVVAFVDAELDRRFPGRALRHAADPPSLQAAWAAVEQAWAGAVERVVAMPPGTVDVSVDGEWSFAQTLRHLVMATDVWLRGAVLGIDNPYHPIGQPNAEYALDGYDTSVFAATEPSFEEVLAVRAGHVALVRDYLASVTPQTLQEARPHWWAPQHSETVLSCLQTILGEEWEHLRFAVRDLDAIERGTA